MNILHKYVLRQGNSKKWSPVKNDAARVSDALARVSTRRASASLSITMRLGCLIGNQVTRCQLVAAVGALIVILVTKRVPGDSILVLHCDQLDPVL